MNKYNDSYYYMIASSDEDIPIFSINEDSMPPDQAIKAIAVDQELPADDDLVLNLELGIFDNNYRLTDYHVAMEPVFKNSRMKLIESLALPKTQFIPCKLKIDGENENTEYYLWHVYNYIECMDKENSVIWQGEDDGEDDFVIEALSLDSDIMRDIPLESRLIFRPDETTSKYIVHKSIVDKIETFNIDGLEFISVAEVLEEES